MTAKLSLDDARYRDAASFQNLLNRSIAEMHRIPGVESAAVGLSVPYERGLNDGLKILDGKSPPAKNGDRASPTSRPNIFRRCAFHFLPDAASPTPTLQLRNSSPS